MNIFVGTDLFFIYLTAFRFISFEWKFNILLIQVCIKFQHRLIILNYMFKT